jgi:hypothetical protein
MSAMPLTSLERAGTVASARISVHGLNTGRCGNRDRSHGPISACCWYDTSLSLPGTWDGQRPMYADPFQPSTSVDYDLMFRRNNVAMDCLGSGTTQQQSPNKTCRCTCTNTSRTRSAHAANSQDAACRPPLNRTQVQRGRPAPDCFRKSSWSLTLQQECLAHVVRTTQGLLTTHRRKTILTIPRRRVRHVMERNARSAASTSSTMAKVSSSGKSRSPGLRSSCCGRLFLRLLRLGKASGTSNTGATHLGAGHPACMSVHCLSQRAVAW